MCKRLCLWEAPSSISLYHGRLGGLYLYLLPVRLVFVFQLAGLDFDLGEGHRE